MIIPEAAICGRAPGEAASSGWLEQRPNHWRVSENDGNMEITQTTSSDEAS